MTWEKSHHWHGMDGNRISRDRLLGTGVHILVRCTQRLSSIAGGGVFIPGASGGGDCENTAGRSGHFLLNVLRRIYPVGGVDGQSNVEVRDYGE
jgi:hypothetical protein